MTSGKFIGLAGLGYWGKNILRNLYELGVLHTACDSNPKTLFEQKSKFPDANYTASFRELLENPEIKAIAIATPAATHYGLIKEALLAGKDVFVEKPLSLTVREGQEVVDLAEEKKKVLMVGHILQYHPAVLKLRELVSSGELGKLQYIYSNRLNIGKLRTEENILWSFAPHDISVILMLVGEELKSVSAFGEEYLSKGIYDTTVTTLDFRNGVKGHIFVSWLHPFKEQKLVVVGSKAMAVFDDMTEEKLFLYPHKIEWKEGKIPVAQKADYKVVEINKGEEPLKQELKHFAECVNTRVRPRTDGFEGLRVLKILEAAEDSLFTKRTFKEESAYAAPETALPAAAEAASSYDTKPAADFFVHETAIVDNGSTVGSGTKIWHFSHVLKNTDIGSSCVIGQNAVIGPDVKVGDKCKIQNNVSVYKGVTLEDEVFCGPSCVFTNVYNPRAFIERKSEYRPTLVKRGATIGANATIVCGTTIGRYALIGAGAVIKKDVPDYAIMAGVPAKQIGWGCKCGVTLKFKGKKAVCECGNEYELEDNAFKIVKEDIDAGDKKNLHARS